ncbi:DNA-directed RNA polymerase sigma-70 factor [Actinoplanes sp. NBRC 14428]|uniref:RNA polymerase sigma-70 factor (ECF subfamily) n=1 Tax=Pseudosporangium ferrugineum TaxID=439699 RepID=A0A2T0SJ38_9ACTN|nr:RNA polymerase sigma factor [Pseudosporangium ferrugineum]PRY33415.1 RNA polymerase sigma-70 factor (ECF subfamily) [Pseudosporangium ferrugineum]BCJ48586.1 DNA-directed RNA polymerase sigma-70 factor [Actinoplanes sp. NBRC 14428]
MNRSTPDPEAVFRELYQATYDDLLLFAERRIHPALADDVVAETFLTAWRRLGDVPAPLDEARAWLFGVAHNVLRNRHRSENRHQGLVLRILREPDAVSGAEAEGVAARVDLVRAWQRLSPDEQQAITLTAFEGLTGAQAGRVLGISRPAFSLRLLRARRRLRRHLRSPHEAVALNRPPHPGTTTEIGTSA